MRIGFWASPSSTWLEGGAKVQILKTKEYLCKNGLEVVFLDNWSGLHQEIDLIHCFGGLDTLTVLEVAKARGIPTLLFLFMNTRQSVVRRFSRKVKYFIEKTVPFETLHKRLLRMVHLADAIVVLSQEHKKILTEDMQVNPEKIRACYLGIDAERFVGAEPYLFVDKYGLKDFVLEVATIQSRKGQLDLIRALDGTGLNIVFIGPLKETEKAYVKEFLNAVKSRKNVHWLGSLSHDDPLLPAAFAAARVHALPSYREGFPLVNLEAAAGGCAVVTGPYPGLREYLGDDYYNVVPGNLRSIRRAVCKAYEDGRQEARRSAMLNFSWDKVLEDLIEIYDELLTKRRHREC